MYKTFLLGAFDSVIGCIKIRDEDAVEAPQQLLDDFPLAALGEDVNDLPEARKNPYISQMSLDVGTGLVCVNEISLDDPLEDLSLGIQIAFRCLDFEVVQRASHEIGAE